MDLVMWLIDEACEIFQVLEPQVLEPQAQGFVTGMVTTLTGLIILAGIAAYS